MADKSGPGCVVTGLGLFALFALLGSWLPDDRASAPPAPPAQLAPDVVAQCQAVIDAAARAGLIRARPEARRINVDERLWLQLDAATKDRTLQAVACTTWRQSMPPGTESAVAYGARSGKRLQMLTSAGMARD